MGGRGFPYSLNPVPNDIGPLVGRFGPGVAWSVVMVAGIPAAAVGAAMLRGARSGALRSLFIIAGALLPGVLLLLMTGLNLLVLLAYIPYAVVGLFTGAEVGQKYPGELTPLPVMPGRWGFHWG